MSDHQILEQRIQALVDKFQELRRSCEAWSKTVAARDTRIGALEAENERLRVQLDELGRDRIELKRLRSERKVLKRSLDEASERLNRLEQEVAT